MLHQSENDNEARYRHDLSGQHPLIDQMQGPATKQDSASGCQIANGKLVMQWNLLGIGRVGFVLVLLGGSALAGPLPTDPNALNAWQGSKIISSGKITATVEYAVYPPGQFSSSAALN